VAVVPNPDILSPVPDLFVRALEWGPIWTGVAVVNQARTPVFIRAPDLPRDGIGEVETENM